MYESENDKPQTTALARLVDKAKGPAEEFLGAVGAVLKAGQYTLDAYGVESNHYSGQRESASVKLDERTTLTIQMVKA
jgi:hypothetical protein